MFILKYFWLGLWVLIPMISQAGATIYYHPTNGTPLQWGRNDDGKAEIHYIVDKGGLGRLTHEQSVQLLQAAMDIWEVVANVEFIFDGATEEAITIDNYMTYLVVDKTICTDNSAESSVENSLQFNRISVIGFDNTNSREILDDIDGLGGTGDSYAIADITCISGSDEDPEFIKSAQIVFAGSYINGDQNDLSVNAYLGVMVHELGHFLGLDHTSANQTIVEGLRYGELNEDEYGIYMPTMSTFYVTEHRATLNPDDIAAIQALYPFEDSPTATITGTVTSADGTDFRGAQIQLHNVDDPLCEVYSFVSGKQCTPLVPAGGEFPDMSGRDCGTSSNPSTNTGDFFLRAIPSGNYRFSAQEVIDDYKEGVIHPFDQFNPLPELFGEAEFYNSGDASSEDPLSMSAITVVDGEDIENLNIVLSDSVADGDGFENLLDLSLFSQSPFTDSLTVTATSRCQPNTVDYAALIGVEEIVGTTGGDDNGSDDGDSGSDSTDSAAAGGCNLVAW